MLLRPILLAWSTSSLWSVTRLTTVLRSLRDRLSTNLPWCGIKNFWKICYQPFLAIIGSCREFTKVLQCLHGCITALPAFTSKFADVVHRCTTSRMLSITLVMISRNLFVTSIATSSVSQSVTELFFRIFPLAHSLRVAIEVVREHHTKEFRYAPTGAVRLYSTPRQFFSSWAACRHDKLCLECL